MSNFDVSFVLKGDDRGTNHVRAGDFVVFLGRLIACLGAVDEAINEASVHYIRIKELRSSSAAATLEPVVQDVMWKKRHMVRPIAVAFGALLEAARERRPAPEWATVEVLQKTRELSETPKHIVSAELVASDVKVGVDDDFRRAIDEFIGGEVEAFGTITGRLDGVNVHSSRFAYLYPGDGTSIACEFSEQLMTDVISALQRRVKLGGLITRRLNSNRPVRVKIFEIEQLPENSDLPLFMSLVGSSPGVTGGASSEEYLSQLREGDD